MRVILLFLSCIFFQGCCSVKQKNPLTEDYTIVKLALENLSNQNYDVYHLLKQPHTSITDRYYKGVYQGEAQFYQDFWYSGSGWEVWGKQYFAEGLREKITIIEDFKNVEKVEVSDKENLKEFVSISRPVYSEKNKKYAVIVVTTISNAHDSVSENHGFVFKKKKGEWKLHLKFTPIFPYGRIEDF